MKLQRLMSLTRKALDDGNTEYMRPLPTANRMYLETDIPLFKITQDRIEPIANNLPELPDVKQARIIEEYNLSEDLATQLVKRQAADTFEAILSDVDVDTTPVASLLAYDLREIKREGYDVDVLTLDHFKGIFTLLCSFSLFLIKACVRIIGKPEPPISKSCTSKYKPLKKD